ncbi:nuclear hormone receptor HR96 isoform X2 [Procambarus clarkii]|uniref:nuclear hormone receptor HR96 isoform X2 n=1 Tax=Procambarus clarkii TaxID=6728 RepID=UPI00374334B6
MKYVSEEATYWVPTGWPVGATGMMMEEGSLASPGEEEPVSSPLDEASTSAANSKRPDSKKCGVCGDRALGYNFNAITCESCKAFFRRNAIKNKDFRCPFEDRCKVNQITRRFCQKCRLRKCFEIGMKKEWIMTDEEKQRKKQKIEENRARKIGDALSDDENIKSTTPFSPFTPVSGTESTKPQAVVVGVIRSDEDGSSKVMRVEGHTDIHSQDRMIIQSTGLAPERLSLPSSGLVAERLSVPPSGLVAERLSVPTSGLAAERLSLSSSYSTDNLNYSSDYASSPSSEHQGALPHYSSDQDYSGNSLSQPQVSIALERFHSEETLRTFPSPVNISDRVTSISFGETKGVVDHDANGLECEAREERDSSPHQTHCQVGPVSPTSHLPHGSLAHMMAINIKKEVEYQDDAQQSPQPLNEPPPLERHPDDTWHNFSVQEALSFLQPGCKSNINATGLTMMDSIMNTAISAEYSAFSLLGSNNPNELNEPEKIKLSELSEANKGLMAPLCEDYNFKDLSNPSLINIINLTEIAIRRLIKMSKRISAFKSLCQEDQIALLKGGCTEMMILRSVCAYDPDKDSWKIQQDHDRFKNIKLMVLKAAPGNVYEEHKRFILAFQPEWRKDHNIIFLLSAITLFNPERPNIIHADAIRHEQCSYLYLLKRYLECKYGGCEGRTVYHRLLERITHLHILSENHIRVFLEVNPQEVEPLLIEIFDLKQR